MIKQNTSVAKSADVIPTNGKSFRSPITSERYAKPKRNFNDGWQKVPPDRYKRMSSCGMRSRSVGMRKNCY